MKGKSTLLLFLVFFAGGLAWGMHPLDHPFFQPAPPTPITQQDPATTKQQISEELGTFAKLAQELKPSVANISVVKNVPQESFPGEKGFQEATGQGSGVLISSDGEVLTNFHVVRGARMISVKLSDGREMEATVVGTDSNTDLALLKLPEVSNLPVARLGNSDELAVGDWVMAIGNPFGLEATVTVGVLSGKGRVIGTGPYDDFLQTDASINPGNSGGPLFNTKGEVIGINTAIVAGGQGIGFSIPINLAKDVAAQLRSDHRVVRGFIGAGIQSLTPALKSALDLPETTSGALVASVIPQGPADKAGLLVSDVILSVNNNRIASDRDLFAEVAKLKAGTEAPFSVLRDGLEQTIFINVIERPSLDINDAQPEQAPQGSPARVGVSVTDMLPPGEPSVVVTQVVPGSAADQAGVKRGDVIKAVGAHPVTSVHEFVHEVSQAKGDLAILIQRRGLTTFVVIKG